MGWRGKVREIEQNTDGGGLSDLVMCGMEGESLGDYSRTSHNGPSKKRTTSLQWTNAVLWIEITIVLIHK